MAEGLNTDPYWWDEAAPQQFPQSPIPEQADIAIVGAGYAGLSAALVLARGGRSVQVFDKQRPGEGASTRNGGLASGNIRMGFGEMITTHGLDTALRFYAEGQTARAGLAEFLVNENIQCDYQPVGRFIGAVRPSHYEAQSREAERLNLHLGIDAEMIPRAEQHREVGSDYYHGGMRRPDLAGLHPAKFHAGLLERALNAGVNVHGSTAVTGVRPEGNQFEVATTRGRINAKHVIIATNGYGDDSDPWLRKRLVPVPSRIIATEPLPAETMARLMPKRQMLGETRQLYHYYRPSPDGRRIIFGGRERAFGGINGEFSKSLGADLAEIFPELKDVPISHSWSGFVAFNIDQLPRLFERDGIHYATGFCGSGVVWAWWLGSKLGLKLLGDASHASNFACEPPRALPFYSGAPWFLPLALLWYGLQDRMGALSKR